MNNAISAGLLMYKFDKEELKVFLVHPGGPFFKNKDDGYWSIPKGLVEKEEELLNTAIREFKEETGIDIKIISVIGEYIEKGVKDDIDYEYYPTCFEVEPIGGELKKQDSEVKEMQLFHLDDLPNPLAFEHEKMIKDYISHLKIGVKPS